MQSCIIETKHSFVQESGKLIGVERNSLIIILLTLLILCKIWLLTSVPYHILDYILWWNVHRIMTVLITFYLLYVFHILTYVAVFLKWRQIIILLWTSTKESTLLCLFWVFVYFEERISFLWGQYIIKQIKWNWWFTVIKRIQ